LKIWCGECVEPPNCQLSIVNYQLVEFRHYKLQR
jgi:hypothetical protein